eukprot:TRINITY_DN39219_c0_g1_i1.p1 TRINITY_DN39219_c0_g1~~TRINITY_DN39219_c0_g1_i1.p1  ORF type:complete len:285 (-),score=64.69 TRINITY_DN39219_c0_g1_i1:76-930(-)
MPSIGQRSKSAANSAKISRSRRQKDLPMKLASKKRGAQVLAEEITKQSAAARRKVKCRAPTERIKKRPAAAKAKAIVRTQAAEAKKTAKAKTKARNDKAKGRNDKAAKTQTNKAKAKAARRGTPGPKSRSKSKPRTKTKTKTNNSLAVGILDVPQTEISTLDPLPIPKRKDTSELRGLDLVEVPLLEFSAAAGGTESQAEAFPGSRRRPKRNCLPPLEAWRNERIIYERPPGSPMPQAKKVVLNTAADPGLAAWAEQMKEPEATRLPLPPLQDETQRALEWSPR